MSHVESQSTAEKDAAENGSESMAALLNDMRSASNITLLRTAEDIVRDKLAESTLLDVANEERVSKFDIHDLKLGRIIGRGAFCCVHEVRSLGSALSVGTKQSSSVASITRMIHNPFSRRASLQDGRDSSTVQSIGNESDPFSNTSFHVQVDSVVVDTGKDFTLFDKSKKYAVKRLDAECMDKIMFLKGVVGLAMEAKFLAALNHVNVIKLYGVSTDGPFADNFFLLLERMDETLTKRIKKWMDIERQCQGITGVFTGSKRKLKEVRSEQMLSAFEIAKGTSHLHQKGIIFRDLKPDNCGFNASGVLKLFDFGLARELKESERLKDGTYKMTGFTGALRYSK
jgi:serine/threonine protein kinase